jgi:hypothetical protein
MELDEIIITAMAIVSAVAAIGTAAALLMRVI